MPKNRNHKLLAFIQSQGLNQTSFAQKIDVNRQTVISWINRDKGVSLSSLYAISSCFGLSLTEVNEELDLGVTLTEADTAIERLQKRFERLEAWFSLPNIETLDKDPAFDTKNFIIGSLYNRNLCVLDVLTETGMTVHDWERFLKTGKLSANVLSELLEWLEIELPVPSTTSPSEDKDNIEPASPNTGNTRRRVSFSTSRS